MHHALTTEHPASLSERREPRFSTTEGKTNTHFINSQYKNEARQNSYKHKQIYLAEAEKLKVNLKMKLNNAETEARTEQYY